MFSSRIFFALFIVTICSFQTQRFIYALPNIEMLDANFDHCLAKNPTDSKTLEKIVRIEPINAENKGFIYCWLQALGFIKDDKPSSEGIKTFLIHSPKIMERGELIANDCTEIASAQTDKYQMSLDLWNCIASKLND